MKKLYLFALLLVLGVAVAGQAEAAKLGNQVGAQQGQQQAQMGAGNQYGQTGIAGDCIPNNTQDGDGAGDGTCDGTGDQDRLQARDRDRLQNQDCDQDCDGPQQTQDRDRVHQATQEQIDAVTSMQRLMERIRDAFHKLYGWN